LVTTEAGGSITFTVALASRSAADLIIGLTSSNTAKGVVAPATLTFTGANWNVALTVTVTGDRVGGRAAFSISCRFFLSHRRSKTRLRE
jgi:hypothetical protein